jgi:glycosyltransferase involved in cell wall biosynthesis
MRVGIVLNYTRHDSTYAALRASEVIRDLGYGILFFDKATKTTRANLHSYWDDFVQASNDVDFSSWVDECQIVIFFSYPTAKEMKIVKKRGIPCISSITWDSIDSETVAAAKPCDLLVCPSKVQTEYFKAYWNLPNIKHVYFDCNWPCTNNERVNGDKLRIITACPGYQIKRVDYNKLFDALNEALEVCPNIDVDFLYSSKVASQIKANVKKHEKTFSGGNSLGLIDDSTGWSEGPLAYSLCDAVFWPTQLESFGYVGIEALTMGTPVITYNHSPMNELVSDRVNGILIPCETKQTELGVSYVEHSHRKIVDIFKMLNNDPQSVHNLKNASHKLITKHKENFVKFWGDTLDQFNFGKDKK